MKTNERIQELINDWKTNPRWKGIKRPYTAEEVVKLQGSYQIAHSIAKRGSQLFWRNVSRSIIVSCK